jgi:O-antigen ligase
MGLQQSNPGRFVGISGDYEMVGILCTIGFIISTFLLRDLREQGASPLVRFLVFLSAIIEIVTLASTGSLTYIIFSLVLTARYFFQQDGKISSVLSVRNALIFSLFAWISLRVIPGRLEARNLQNFSINDFQDLLVLTNRSRVWNSIFSNDGWSPYAILGKGLPYPLELFKTWPHNTFVTLWIISGILGMIAFLILFLAYLKYFIRERRCLPDWLRYCNYLFLTASFTTDFPKNPGVLFLLASTMVLTINLKKERN